MKESSPDTANGAADFLECDRVFHLIIATASANRVLRAVVRDVHELLTTSWLLSDLSRDDFSAIYDQHSLIAQAIIDRDGSRAASVMREHLEWAAAKDRTAERELDGASPKARRAPQPIRRVRQLAACDSFLTANRVEWDTDLLLRRSSYELGTAFGSTCTDGDTTEGSQMSVPQASAKQEGSKARVTGLVPPIATPFRDGALDLDSLHRLLDDLSDHVSGVLVGGSVGEAASMTIEERITVMREVDRGLDRNRQYLAVSVSDNSIEYSRELAYAAGEVGADVAMVSCPNYFTNDSAMLEAYFAALSDFTPCDLCLYDNPIASHTTLSIPDIVRLTVAAPRLTHVKVTDTSVDKVAALRDATDLQVLAGDDAVLWHQLTRGAQGGWSPFR